MPALPRSCTAVVTLQRQPCFNPITTNPEITIQPFWTITEPFHLNLQQEQLYIMCMAESFTEYSISKLLMLPTDGKRQATCMMSIQLQNEHPETRNPDALRPSCSLTEQREIHPQTKLLRRSFNRQVKRRGRFLHICTGLKGNRASGPISTTV